MKPVIFIHWKPEEIPERTARLKQAGFKAVPFTAHGGEGLRELCEKPPAAFIIDLSRLPSHGRAVAVFLRQQKGTRRVPLIFVDGDDEKIARVRRERPDAIYTNWRGIAGAMKKALAWKLEKPVIAGAMDAYSKTPLPKKLGVDGDRSVRLIGAPPGFEKSIGLKKGDARLVQSPRCKADVVIYFTKTVAEFKQGLPKAKNAIADGGGLWIAWPKKTSGVSSDLSERIVRETGLKSGLVDYKICAIDHTWSGLKFARRGK